MSTVRGQEPAVVVVHGALGSAAQLEPLGTALRAALPAAPVVNVELPGHGTSSLPADTPFTMDGFADGLAARLEAAGIQRPLVVGYSMGGYVALRLAQRSPAHVGGVVTLGTMLRWTPEVAARAARRLDPATLRAKVPAFAASLEARHASGDGWELVLTRTAALLRALGDAPLLTPVQLGQVECPVRLLVGERDDTVTWEETAEAATQLPHATAVLLPETPHPIEQVPLALVVQEVHTLWSHLRAGA